MRSLATRIGLLAAVDVVAILAIVGCEGDVEQFDAPDASAGGTTSTGSGSTGAGGAGVSEAGPPPYCGGLAGTPCGPTEYCDFADDDCGGDDGQGVCLPRPDGCTEDCPGACGCDGEFYCNPCMAQSEGIDVSTTAACGASGGQYAAQLWLGGLDHLIVTKVDPVRDICVRLFADWPMDDAPGFTFTMPSEWGVSRASVSNLASDCDSWDTQPAGDVVDATGGSGTISWVVPQGMYYPCELNIDATLSFAGTEPWLPATEPLTTTSLPIDGGCL
jgi:hypothetical protein